MGYSFTVYKGSSDGSIKESTTQRGPLEKDQVLVKLTHSGVCGTDLHYRTVDMVLGHEGAGVVEEVGPEVHSLKKNDRVGFGYVHSSCEKCEQCLTGWETFCPQRQMYGYADQDEGSFGTHVVWREAFLFRIPDGLSSLDAAPLMCGGSTVFNAMYVAGVQPTARVGIVGIGGLGHLAIQFANKMGCEVVVFSGTDNKKEEALKLGAHEFYATKGVKELAVGRQVDHLVVTTSFPPDWNLFLPVLKPRATILPLTAAQGDFAVPQMAVIGQGLRVQGAIVSSRAVHQKMLDFAALHGIKPVTMTFPMSAEGAQNALKTLDEGKMRYRGVLVKG